MLRNLMKITPKMQSPAVLARYISSNFTSLEVSKPQDYVTHVKLNRPKTHNSFNRQICQELVDCFAHLNTDPETRAIVLSGNSKNFCSGLDVMDMLEFGQKVAEVEDIARKAKIFEDMLITYQAAHSAPEFCVKPVIAAIHGACIGSGVEIILGADIRLCSKDAWFQVKEVILGLAADGGALQRLPKVIGNHSLVRELCYTGRKMASEEALRAGLVSEVFENGEKAVERALELASEIAKKSPVAVQTTKKNLVFSEARTNQEGLDHIREMNKFLLQSQDFIDAVVAQQTKETPEFPNY
jgi:delta(3,5)-delta(2,4)-dienoyl-CoA isomerase